MKILISNRKTVKRKWFTKEIQPASLNLDVGHCCHRISGKSGSGSRSSGSGIRPSGRCQTAKTTQKCFAMPDRTIGWHILRRTTSRKFLLYFNGVAHKCRQPILDIFWRPTSSIQALLLTSQNRWSLLRRWRHLWTTTYHIALYFQRTNLA